jgi:nucleoside-diphosphate-sugar epimerase
MQSKAFVTGANGFTGRYFCQYLAEKGVATRAMYYPPDGKPEISHENLELVPGDLRDRDTLRGYLQDVERVYHIGALYRPSNVSKQDFWDVNVEGTRHMIELSADAGVDRFVNCSTIGVHGNVLNPPATEDAPIKPDDYYQVTKLKGEELARDRGAELGLKVTTVRPAAIYGRLEPRFIKLVKLISRRRFIMFGSGEVPYHFIHVRDLSDAFVLCAERDVAIGQTYIIADDHPLTLNKIVNLTANTINVPPPKMRFPLWSLKMAAVTCEALCKPFRISPPIHWRRAAWFWAARSFDISKAKRDLGFDPKIAPEDGLVEMIESYGQAGWLS